MSDTSDTEPTGPYRSEGDPNAQGGPVYGGRTEDDDTGPAPKPLNFRLDSDFGDVGKQLDDANAIRILTRRLHGSSTTRRVAQQRLGRRTGGTQYGGFGQAEYARKLLQLIPEEMRTDTVLQNADLRPLLSQIGAMDEETAAAAGFNSDDQFILMAILVNESDRIRKEAEKSILPLVPEGDENAAIDASNIIDKIVNSYRTGTAMRIDTRLEDAGTGTIATNPQTGATVATGGVGAAASSVGFNLDGIEDLADEDQTEFLSRDEIEYLARETTTSEETIGTLLGEDYASRQGEIAGGKQYELMYDDTGGKDRIYGLPGGEPKYVSQPNRMTAREVVDLPSTMTRSEIFTLGKKLYDAGFMTEEMTDPSDFSDPQFKRAWQNLMYKSIERGESMVSLLDAQVKARQEALEDSYTPLLTDPARIRMNGDALGSNILGRNLKPEEQQQLVQFIHELERRNAKIEAGFDPDADGTLEDLEGEAIQADLEARMNEWIRSENPEEAGGKDMADAYDTMTQLFAGPGQPGLVR